MYKHLALPLCLLLFLAFASPALARSDGLKIIAGTSLIEDIVSDLTGGRAEILTMIKGSSCPGHENIKTSDFVFAAKADLVLIHAFQKDMPQLTSQMGSVGNEKLRLVILEPKGSWLIPEIQKQAVSDIAEILAGAAPGDAAKIRERAAARLEKIDLAGAENLKLLAAIQGKPVAVAGMQSEFIRWAGLDVLLSYKRAEEMTPRDVARAIDELRGRRPAGIVDNYQSGPDAGLPLALELKVPHLVISNFPGFNDVTPDYFSLLRYNVDQLLKLGG